MVCCEGQRNFFVEVAVKYNCYFKIAVTIVAVIRKYQFSPSLAVTYVSGAGTWCFVCVLISLASLYVAFIVCILVCRLHALSVLSSYNRSPQNK